MKYLRTPCTPLLASMAAALLLGVLVPLNAAALQMRGFRGLMWGDPPAHLGAAQVVAREGNVQCYRRERENLLFGDSELRSVLYCFHHDKLFLVAINSMVGLEALRAEFERGYGPPDTRTPAEVRWGDGASAVSAELVVPSAGAPASLRLKARDFAPGK